MAPPVFSRVATLHFSAIALVPAIALIQHGTLHAATPAAPALLVQEQEKTLYIGVIEGDDVYVRSGAGPAYYPFHKVNRGDMVKVTGERFGFVSVALVGPAFKDTFGYVKYSSKSAMRLRVSADGASAVTLGRVDIVAPNLEAGNNATDSWKVIARLDANKPLKLLETNTAGDETVYKVAMPGEAIGWINAQFVPRAPADEASIFEDILAGKLQPAPTEPEQTVAAANTSNEQSQPPATNPPADQTTPAVDGTVSAQAPSAASDQLVTDGELVAIAPVPQEQSQASQPERSREPTWDDLERAFKALQQQPVETAELQPMRDMYSSLAERQPDDRRIQRFTAARIKQIDIWQTLQHKKLEVLEATARMKLSAEDTEAARLALERSAEYTAIGRVAVSNIYDGTSLPKLFRLQDAATGRTVAYLKPDADYALANRIDVIVGIVGDKVYDESLRLNLITPRRIDALSPEARPATPNAAPAAPSAEVAGASTDSEDK